VENQPLSGSTTAFATRYAVSTQVASSTLEERLPAMCGSATLATLVSSTSMKVASITVPAITQGFIAGPRDRAQCDPLLRFVDRSA
jgi:hypothetical protein